MSELEHKILQTSVVSTLSRAIQLFAHPNHEFLSSFLYHGCCKFAMLEASEFKLAWLWQLRCHRGFWPIFVVTASFSSTISNSFVLAAIVKCRTEGRLFTQLIAFRLCAAVKPQPQQVTMPQQESLKKAVLPQLQLPQPKQSTLTRTASNPSRLSAP